MTESQFLVADSLSATINELCQRFGAWRTARALLLAVWRQRQTAAQISHLSDYLLRDIGLPEREDGSGQPGDWLPPKRFFG